MFDDILFRAKFQARQPLRLTPGQRSELQRAAALLKEVVDHSTDERLTRTLRSMFAYLYRITRQPPRPGKSTPQ